ncbi:hypothetical protein QWZ02_16615 [Kinneretia asaccharophila]|uniref:Uncharacterized protein n=2 Tax=Roseateles asaccharophilus TaxID=582607 RepID=A0A4R6N756_9BURK|nr:hypothetical protein [Roseateles asaccharophilus]MDN3546082.1 hypothetical protein [Roseateles asaccharophilus]TDP11189.1 hypothetical protein DFR39_103112 [Roseateles asaccharophilus]
MNPARDIALIDQLLAQPAETAWLEFKGSNTDPEMIGTQAVLYGPRSFAEMTQDERVRACYFHAVLKFLSGDKMKNASLCARLGIAAKNAAQASAVISKTLDAGLIRVADPEHPRAGYLPHWA